MYYMSSDFDAASSSSFPFRTQTNKQMRLNALPHASGYTAGVGNYTKKLYNISTPQCLRPYCFQN